MSRISVILVAGGIGSRMQAPQPKQFLPLHGKPIVRYSLDLFLSMPEISEVILVCHPAYRHFFANDRVIFALPGERRQDSVYNGLQEVKNSDFVCIHDSARPNITIDNVREVIEAAKEHGAAALGMPIKFTIKESDADDFVVCTPDRSKIWEIQTPQVIRYDLLNEGFKLEGLTVTDDVSLVEHLGRPVKLVKGSYSNLKITTKEDLAIAHQLLWT